MTILNLMLGRKRGGLEQAALDYAEALTHAGLPALTLISPNAWVETPLVSAGMAHQSLPNLGYWDWLAAQRLRSIAKQTKARAIICHGNRALGLALLALKGRIPVIAVAHNYATKRFTRADHCFAITEHLEEYLRAEGVTQITLMPNMVRMPPPPLRVPYRTPPILGAMGRFETKKGFDIYIQALAILQERSIAFHALLGGDGTQADALRSLIEHCGLQEKVTLTGWVQDKPAFFDAIDLFILPSRYEAFGIVLIEAMAHQVPVITSDAEGPLEIVQHVVHGLSTPRGDPLALANTIAQLLADEPYAVALAKSGRKRVEDHYTIDAMAARLKKIFAHSGALHG